jgi:hypothetical protein
MGIKKVEDGKARILRILVEAAEELGVPLPKHEWKQGGDSTHYDDHLLVFYTLRGSIEIEFSYHDLCDCTYDPTVRARVKARLKGLLQSL